MPATWLRALPGRGPAAAQSAGAGTVPARQLLEQVRGFGDPPPFFVITGGDPFKRPDLFDLVEYGAAEPGEPGAAAIGRSACDLPERRRCERGRARPVQGCAGQLRVDAARWQSALDAVLRVQINTTVTPSNLAELPDLLAVIAQCGVLTWSVLFLAPTGHGSRLARLTPQQAEDALNFRYDANRIVSVKTTGEPAFRRVSNCRRISRCRDCRWCNPCTSARTTSDCAAERRSSMPRRGYWTTTGSPTRSVPVDRCTAFCPNSTPLGPRRKAPRARSGSAPSSRPVA